MAQCRQKTQKKLHPSLGGAFRISIHAVAIAVAGCYRKKRTGLPVRFLPAISNLIWSVDLCQFHLRPVVIEVESVGPFIAVFLRFAA